MKQFNNIYVVVLAAGKGTRMNNGRPSTLPKVLLPLAGKPMISYILETLKKLGIAKPTLVVGYKAEEVKRVFGDQAHYVLQRKRLGTGQAAKIAIAKMAMENSKLETLNPKQILNPKFKNEIEKNNLENLNSKNYLGFRNSDLGFENENCVFILQGDDSAFYRAETLRKFINNHLEKGAVLSFLTTRIAGIKDLGRVVRDKNGEIAGVVEKEEMTSLQQQLDEINCGAYLLDFSWARANLKKIKRHYKGGKEYPLPDIIKIALNDKKKVIGWEIPAKEWVGINLPEQLRRANEMMGYNLQNTKLTKY